MAAILSVIDAAMLRPLPYLDPEQLVTVQVEITLPDGRVSRPTTSMADMRLWQQSDDVFSKVAGWGSAFGGRIVDGPEPERIRVSQFTEDYLSMHGVTPLIGRDFTFEDTQSGAPSVALLGYDYWQTRYAGRRDVIGETLRLDDGMATIIGVLPVLLFGLVPAVRLSRVRIAPALARWTPVRLLAVTPRQSAPHCGRGLARCSHSSAFSG